MIFLRIKKKTMYFLKGPNHETLFAFFPSLRLCSLEKMRVSLKSSFSRWTAVGKEGQHSVLSTWLKHGVKGLRALLNFLQSNYEISHGQVSGVT